MKRVLLPVKPTMKLRLVDEMFVEFGLTPNQELPLPCPNIPPQP